jgi:hypothetical protein
MIVLWSVKGGSGATVAACSLALRRSALPTLLVDLAGDAPAAFGLPEPGGPGVGDWLRSPGAGADELRRLAVTVNAAAALVPMGQAPPPDADWGRLVAALAGPHTVVVDAGTGEPPASLVAEASASLLVTRACFLALRRAARTSVRPTGVVLVDEPGRALGATDVERTVGAPVVASLKWDPAVARAVDAGLLASRLPHSLSTPLRRVA